MILLRAAPWVTLALLLGPLIAGVAGIVLAAFGVGYSAEPAFGAVFAWPGLVQAVALSVWPGLAATVISLAIVTLFVAGWSDSRVMRWMQVGLAPLLAVPHAAAAFGLVAVIAPSGWIMRGVATVVGMERPADVLIPADPWGLALIGGLVVKEVPFLLLVTLAALPQVPDARRVVASLGYGPVIGWFKTVFPMLYPLIRLPVLVVLAFSMTVVDMALILGPTTPPTLSVQVLRWMTDPDISMRTMAAAGALVQLAVVLAVLALWFVVERGMTRWGRGWIQAGRRSFSDTALRVGALGATFVTLGVLVSGLIALAVWSSAGFWSFPDPWPDVMSLKTWQRHGSDLLSATGDTALLALMAVGISLLLVIACLEEERLRGRPLLGLWLLYLPLLVPQIVFLPGLQLLFLGIGADSGFWPVLFAHVIFVLPYVMLATSGAYRAWNSWYERVAAALGVGPMGSFLRLRLPMLVPVLLAGAAIGCAVSVAQYLPTLLMGAGRVQTITTEAVALSSGRDARAIGAFGLAQSLAALLPYGLAMVLPAILYRNRKGMLP